MREPDIEGVATHDVPESCGVVRKDGVEALTGEHASWVLSRETKVHFRTPTLLSERQATRRDRKREVPFGPARSETPCERVTFLRENREIPWSPAA